MRKDVLDRNRKIGESENRIRQKEQSINQKTDQLEKQIKDNEAIKDNLNRPDRSGKFQAFRIGKAPGRTYPAPGKNRGTYCRRSKKLNWWRA